MTRVAPAALSILTQATIYRPTRSTDSDGTVGDARHSRTESDHNEDESGLVLASDLTHDLKHGVDAHGWIRWRVKRGDRRIRYAISNGQIWSRARASEGWRKYTGSNPHYRHVHTSIEKAYADDVSEWFAGWLVDVRPPAYHPIEESEEDDEMAYIRDLKTGRVWRLHGNTARHLSPSALDLDIYLGVASGKPIKIVDVKDPGPWLKNMLDAGTGKGVVL